jgi:hypothetical protein
MCRRPGAVSESVDVVRAGLRLALLSEHDIPSPTDAPDAERASRARDGGLVRSPAIRRVIDG